MNQVDGVQTKPPEPQTNIFQLFRRGDPETLIEKHEKLAQETGTYLLGQLSAAPIPGYSVMEVHCWENLMILIQGAS
tara:strand:- start:2322 stop:2552 length:231 start_codon:yes stop_codon:yes gene_type:complete